MLYESKVNGIINGKLIKQIQSGIYLPKQKSPILTDWNTLPQWQPSIQFKQKGGSLIQKYQSGNIVKRPYNITLERNANYDPYSTIYTFPSDFEDFKKSGRESKDWINWWLMNREDILA